MVISKTKFRKKTSIFLPLKKREGSGSVLWRYGSEDPDPYQNVTDPEHWFHLVDRLKKNSHVPL